MTIILGLIVIIAVIIILVKTAETNHQDVQQELAQKMYGAGNSDIVTDLETETRRIQAFIQANIVGDRFVADAINTGSYTGPLPEKRSDGGWLSIFDNLRILSIAGINHRKNIDHYTGRVECALVPEPTNEFDPNAIKIVAEDSHHLGYIPTDQTEFVRSLTANEFPHHCTAFIDEHEDELDGHKFFTGFVYIKRLD